MYPCAQSQLFLNAIHHPNSHALVNCGLAILCHTFPLSFFTPAAGATAVVAKSKSECRGVELRLSCAVTERERERERVWEVVGRCSGVAC